MLIRKRTSRTYLGYLWFVIPLVMPLIIGALVFGGILRVQVGEIPYFLYFTVASGTWLFFSQAAYYCTRSLEISRGELRRVYVPRLAVFTTAVTIPSIALVVNVVLGAVAAVYYLLTRGKLYLVLSAWTPLVPLALLMLVVLAWSWALWTAPIAPCARDIRRVTHYALAMLAYVTPVIYSVQNIPSGFRFLASLNPVTAPLEIVKQGILGQGHVTALGLVTWAAAVVVPGVPGIHYFARKERRDMAFY
jgi:ABC-type polysaccharide/polyol phosphate export permease